MRIAIQTAGRALFLLTLLLAQLTRAENWPSFRGPDRQGHSTETSLPLDWSATSHIAWKTEIAGEGSSSPIVWDDRVFITTATDGGASCHVLCFDRKSGKILWDKEALRQIPGHKQPNNTYATP